MSALTKVETPLMERYETKCASCGWDRHFFGTEKEARESALTIGWEFRIKKTDGPKDQHGERFWLKEVALCPHCKILTKEKP